MAAKSKSKNNRWKKKKRLAARENPSGSSNDGGKKIPALANASSRKPAETTKTARSEANPVNNTAISDADKGKSTGAVKKQRNVPTKVNNGWVPKGETVVIAERKIPGMVYIFDSSTVRKNDRRLKSKVNIDTSKLVGGRDKKGFILHTMHYGEMEPANRASFLDWLATGKKDTDFHPTYPRMYIFGLERRLLFDKTSDNEKQDITKELVRLNKIFSGVEGIDKEVQDVLNFAELLRNPYESKLISYPNKYLNFSPRLFIDISNSISKGEKLSAEMLLEWYAKVPNPKFDARKLRNSNFRDSFVENFYSSYGNGLEVESPGVFLQLEYQALSGEFKVVELVTHNGRPVLDIRKLSSPLNVAHKIATKSVRQSKFKGREFMPSTNLKALGVLAKSSKGKWSASQSKKYEFLRMWALQLEEENTRLAAKDVVSNSLFESVKGISIDQWERTDNVFSTIGFGIAPNTLLYLDSPRRNDPVVIYDLKNTYDLELDYSHRYFGTLVKLGVCSYLMHTLNLNVRKSNTKLRKLVNKIEGLAEFEYVGLHANIEYLLDVPPDNAYLSRLRQRIGSEFGDTFRPVITNFVKDKDHYDSNTVSAVEKVYRNLYLDPKLAYPDLHAGKIFEDSSGTEKQKLAVAELDEKLVESIRTDTEKVSKLLGEIFVVDGQDLQEAEKTAENIQEQAEEFAIRGLDKSHLEFLGKLVEKDFWTEDSFAKLANKHGLLPVGAAETINEWIFERYDDTLLDEQDGFNVAANIAESLKTELNKGYM